MGSRQQREHRQAGGQRQSEREQDPDHQEQREAADHRDRRQHQHQEAGGGRQARGGDHGPAPSGRLDRRARGRGAPLRSLDEPSLELDRVVDREADQHRQHRDRGHGQRAADQRQGSEGEPRCAERDCERKQPHRRAEDQRQGDHHDRERRREQDEHLGRELLGKPCEDHRNPADHVAGRLRSPASPGQPETRVRDRLPKQRDRLLTLGVAEVRAQPDRDQRRARAGNDRGEPRLRYAPRRGAFADHRGDEARAVEPRQAELAVLKPEVEDPLSEPQRSPLTGGCGGLLLLRSAKGRVSSPRERLGGCVLGLGLARGRLLPQDPVGLDRELVEEGRRAEDDRARVEARDRRARRRRRLAADHPAAGGLAREAPFERQHPAQVASLENLAQLPLDQDLDRLVAERPVEALGRGIGARATVDQRVGAAIGLEPKRRDRPDQAQQDGRHDHRRRPLHGTPGDPCQQISHPHLARVWTDAG